MAQPQLAVVISRALAHPGRDDPGRRWAGVLQEVPLFENVPKRQLRKIAALTRERRYHRGTKIVRVGEPGDDFFLVLEGRATVARRRGLSRIQFGPGSYFGELALIDGGPRSATVVAETEVRCLRLARASFQRLLRSEAEVGFALLREFTGRIRELQARTELTA
jgi:CRP-like cAMP-binding protein